MLFEKCIHSLIATDDTAAGVTLPVISQVESGVDSYIGGLMRARLIEEKFALEKSVLD